MDKKHNHASAFVKTVNSGKEIINIFNLNLHMTLYCNIKFKKNFIFLLFLM